MLSKATLLYLQVNTDSTYFCLIFVQPKGGLDFAAELAAKIGVAPVKQQDDENDDDEKASDDERSDNEHQEPQTAEVPEKQRSETKGSRSDSKTKEKKSHHHHHHHKKDRSESHGEHKHRKRRNSKTSHSSVDTRQSVPAEDGENTLAVLELKCRAQPCPISVHL